MADCIASRRWHLGEVFVKVNGKLYNLWRAVDHEGEVLKGVVTARRLEGAALKAPRAASEEIRRSSQHRHRCAARLFRGDERGRQRRSPSGRRSAQQSRGEFTSAVSTTRAGDAAVPKREDAAEALLSPQSFQSGASSRHEASLQTGTLGRVSGVARTRGVDRRLRTGMSRHA
jgi:hypothetical protein